MGEDNQVELLKVLWRQGDLTGFTTTQGERIEVVRGGEYDQQRNRYFDAEVIISGVVHHGEVVVWAGDSAPLESFESTVLHVTPYPSARIIKQNGEPIVQLVFNIDPVTRMAYDSLKEGAKSYGCAGHLSRLESHERVALFTRLTVDRLERKCADLNQLYQQTFQNWGEAMYMQLFATMGQSNNKKPFMELASRVRYSSISRERNSILYVEAMLLGASGLLEMYDDDQYIRELKSAFEYLRRKYKIEPMRAGVWQISRNNPNNHPVVRIAQLASFLSTEEFLFDNIIKCSSAQDIQRLFRAEASQYWSTHYLPGRPLPDERPKRMGHGRANLMGINLAAPLMFAYGNYMGDELMKERAVELLEKIECESNFIVDAWRRGGVVMESAFDSQAIIQLSNEYCGKSICWLCPMGRQVVGSIHDSQKERQSRVPTLEKSTLKQ